MAWKLMENQRGNGGVRVNRKGGTIRLPKAMQGVVGKAVQVLYDEGKIALVKATENAPNVRKVNAAGIVTAKHLLDMLNVPEGSYAPSTEEVNKQAAVVFEFKTAPAPKSKA